MVAPDAEESLVQRAVAGDTAALGALIERHIPGLRAFIRLRMGKELRAKESASDLVQSVCREVLEHADRFRYPGEKQFKQWLYREAFRKVANRAAYLKAERRDVGREQPQSSEESYAQLSMAYTSFSPSRDARAREHAERLEAAFDQLSDEYREVIVLSRVMGLSRAEMAVEMGRTEPAVRSLLSRALSRLAEHLAHDD